jgi:hypothetical protein
MPTSWGSCVTARPRDREQADGWIVAACARGPVYYGSMYLVSTRIRAGFECPEGASDVTDKT